MTKAVQKAVNAHTQRLVAAGGCRMELKLSPEATSALRAYCDAHGVSRTKAIEAAIKLMFKQGLRPSGEYSE